MSCSGVRRSHVCKNLRKCHFPCHMGLLITAPLSVATLQGESSALAASHSFIRVRTSAGRQRGASGRACRCALGQMTEFWMLQPSSTATLSMSTLLMILRTRAAVSAAPYAGPRWGSAFVTGERTHATADLTQAPQQVTNRKQLAQHHSYRLKTDEGAVSLHAAANPCPGVPARYAQKGKTAWRAGNPPPAGTLRTTS